MALDTLSRELEFECCWVQTISDREGGKLALASERGFTPEMRREIGAIAIDHVLSKQVIGLGHQIIIPDLSNDGLYGLPSLRKSGLRWMVAVPMMTYRAHGILGVASRNRKSFDKDTPDLIMVIGGLIANALSRASLGRKPMLTKDIKSGSPAPPPEKPESAGPLPVSTASIPAKAPLPASAEKPAESPPPQPAPRPDSPFRSHARKMDKFRKSHR